MVPEMKPEKVMELANELYAVAKGADAYTAPELRPEIYSQQIICTVKALCHLLNEEKNNE